MIGLAGAQPSKTKLPAIKPGTNTSFGPLKQINASLLNVGYAEVAPPTVPQSFFCTAGPTTFTAMSMSPRLLAPAGYRVSGAAAQCLTPQRHCGPRGVTRS